MSSLKNPPLKRKSSLTRLAPLRLTFYPPRSRSSSTYRCTLRLCGWVFLIWVAVWLVAPKIRLVYSHWRHIPVEVLDHCTDVTWWFQQDVTLPGFANASFEVPGSEPLSLVSQGNLSYGTIEILPNPNITVENTKVEISVYFRTRNLLDSARVCSLAQPKVKIDVKHGLMFYTPERSVVPSIEDQLRFHIQVLLPSLPTSSGSRPHLRSLKTDLPTFEHRVGDLGASHKIDQIHLRTLKPIHVHSLNAESITLQTLNSSVTGAMTSWSHVHVETSNAAINANITLTAHPDLHSKHTELFMKTSNAALISTITLEPISSTNPDTFKLTTKTTNGPLLIAFPAPPPVINSTISNSTNQHLQPLPPILRFDGQTTHAPALVELSPLYAGLFTLRSTEMQPRLITKHRDGTPERKFTSKVLESGNLLKGRIYPLAEVAPRTGRSTPPPLVASSAMPPAWVNVRTTYDRVEVWV